MAAKYKVNISASSTVGSRRCNQDNLMIDEMVSHNSDSKNDFHFQKQYTFSDEDSLYLVICDGLGEEIDGSNLSETAVLSFFRYLNDMKKNRIPGSAEEALGIYKGIIEASRQVMSYIERRKISDSGTTFTLLKINSNATAEVFNIGNSPVYLLRNKEFTLLSEEQKIGSMLGEPTGKAVAKLYYSGLIPYKKNDIFIAASDGLFSSIDKEHILDVFSVEVNASELIRRTKQTLRRTENDNITAIVAELKQIRFW